jgi:hypothetical protein
MVSWVGLIKNSVASFRKWTIPTGRPPLVSEVCANFFAVKGCLVVSLTNPHGRILGFLDRSRYYFFQVAPQLYSRGWVDSVPDPLLFFPLVVTGNRTRDLRICSQILWQAAVARVGIVRLRTEGHGVLSFFFFSFLFLLLLLFFWLIGTALHLLLPLPFYRNAESIINLH